MLRSGGFAKGLALALMLGLSGCGGIPKQTAAPDDAKAYVAADPYNLGRTPRKFAWEDVRRIQPISFCYGRPLDEADDLRAEAEYICKGGKVEYYGQDVGLRRCPLFQPYRMTFICFPAESLETSSSESSAAQ
jgi:hypothetical protein